MLETLDYNTRPHQFVATAYSQYRETTKKKSNATNGKIFEYLICETLAQEGITPFYFQASFTYVANADFDIVLYHDKRPVVLTMKTSMRERYKQAALEAWALWQVYRSAETWLLTLHEKEANNVQDKINKGEIVGMNGCILASTPDYDKLLYRLKEQEFMLAEPIVPLAGRVYPV